MKNSRENNEQWIVKEENELLKFLFEVMPDRSKKSVRAVLARGQVFINDRSTSQFNDKVVPGDTVAIRLSAPNKKAELRGVKILHEDSDVIVVEKDAGLLSISTTNENDKTVYRYLSDYVKQSYPRNMVFIVHRLDRETSGVMVFAKNKKAQQTLQNNWKRIVTERTYIALVEGRVEKDGSITSWLTEDKTLTMHSSKTENHGKKATTRYEIFKTNRKQTMLKVNLETGRKNQIRIHMKELGHPIVGDKKYGAITNPFRRIGLHAHVLAFNHPITGQQLRFESEIPKPFMLAFK
ncbi:RluA family pseudouridine synthase [Macrococcus carouselicus]|uniref:Pseudouridine synthase n=1 Tax=Macrococcus carouselicus TaxID=69969 RepID=A0A9Q8FLH7_9STAP|nr:RluA family pseudouridine synthase [Macrococcus carouselicus]TDM02236.1 RluA family pseudouridine synthase [Macrococcus carouselicus]